MKFGFDYCVPNMFKQEPDVETITSSAEGMILSASTTSSFVTNTRIVETELMRTYVVCMAERMEFTDC